MAAANPESAHHPLPQPTLVAATGAPRHKVSDALYVTLFLAVEILWVAGLGMLAAWLIFS